MPVTLDSYADIVLRIIPATSSKEWAENFPSPLSSFLFAELLTLVSPETWEDWKMKKKYRYKDSDIQIYFWHLQIHASLLVNMLQRKEGGRSILLYY